MLFSIVNLSFQVIIIVLLIRFFVERYRYYGFGPVMVALVTITERLLQPIKRIIPRHALYLQDYAPFFVILVVIVIRGLVIWAMSGQMVHSFLTVHQFGTRLAVGFFHAQAVSFAMGATLIAQATVACLFASWMISRRGIQSMYNAGFVCFQERTFAVFQFAKRYVKSDDIGVLFWVSGVVILLLGAVAAATLNLTFIYGIDVFGKSIVNAVFEMILSLLHIYWFILLLAIIASWVSADHLSVIVQIVRAMSDPYLNFFRRLMPWARIDFIDLSPIFAFLVLNPGIVYLITVLQYAVLNSLGFADRSVIVPNSPNSI